VAKRKCNVVIVNTILKDYLPQQNLQTGNRQRSILGDVGSNSWICMHVHPTSNTMFIGVTRPTSSITLIYSHHRRTDGLTVSG